MISKSLSVSFIVVTLLLSHICIASKSIKFTSVHLVQFGLSSPLQFILD